MDTHLKFLFFIFIEHFTFLSFCKAKIIMCLKENPNQSFVDEWTFQVGQPTNKCVNFRVFHNKFFLHPSLVSAAHLRQWSGYP